MRKGAHRQLPSWELEVRFLEYGTCGPCGGGPGTGALDQPGGGCWGSGRTTGRSGCHKGPGTQPRGTTLTSRSSLRRGHESGLGEAGRSGGDQSPSGRLGVGLTCTVWAGLAAPGPPVLADAELAVSLDALPGPVVAAIHQAGALPWPHALPLGSQHLPRGAPAA